MVTLFRFLEIVQMLLEFESFYLATLVKPLVNYLLVKASAFCFNNCFFSNINKEEKYYSAN